VDVKVIKLALSIICASALSTGCSYLGASRVPTGQQMIGTWSGESSGHENGKNTGTAVTFVIDKAAGQSFSGSIKYKYRDGRSGQEPIQGSIGKSGTIAIADKDGFYINGTLDNARLSLQYIEASPEEIESSNVYLEKE
jgi:hypothetical protein